MNTVYSLLETCRSSVRNSVGVVAKDLNAFSKGKISPNMITIVGLLAHIPIAWLIAYGKDELAAILLIVFGLFDTLDGALARVQNSASKTGMLLDSITDRAKEVILYIGVAYTFVAIGRPYMTLWAVAGCGSSLLVSYVNAWGEVVLGQGRAKTHAMNKAFRTGIMTFEVRMTVLVLGLVFNQLIPAVMIISLLALVTAVSRFINIAKALKT
ncbi:MAG: CDP-alcohol phosphatidyltransferase family protein [Patescibacteria group bacterium]